MKEYLVVSMIGADRTGLVDRVTAAIKAHRGNLEDSRMSVLGGEFAMVMLVSVPSDHRQELLAQVGEVAQELDLVLSTKLTTPRRTTNDLVPMTVHVRGMDHEGIVHEVVHALVEQGISVDALDSSLTHAAHTGTPMFAMTLRLSAPASISMTTLQAKLATVADQLALDIDVETRAGVGVR